jgi:formylglycine-generating enzyme required for sulfatase activity
MRIIIPIMALFLLAVFSYGQPAGMKLIPGGSFLMGSTTGDSTALPVHTVTVSSFYMDSTEVTQDNYQTLTGIRHSYFKDDGRRPVEMVTWFDAVLYCNARSKRDKIDTIYSYISVKGTPSDGCRGLGSLNIDYGKKGYRLPTEAEWEYACRAKTTTVYYWGNDTSIVGNYAWFDGNSENMTHPVAQKQPNAYGLYDIIGNVYESCNDWCDDENYDIKLANKNPQGPVKGFSRALRGGSWGNSDSDDLYSARRYHGYPDGRLDRVGFRCVRSAQ